MSKKSKQKETEIEKAWEEAVNNAIHVTNDVDLKTAIGKKALVIISSDSTLYERLLKKMPKENVSAGGKRLGKVLVWLGAAITVLSFGAFAFVGVPMAGAGAVLGAAGLVLDDYKDYSLFLDYDNKQVAFFKVKGTPHLELPKGASPRKLVK